MTDYPLAEATLKRLLAERTTTTTTASAPAAFRLGPPVLRAPPPTVRAPVVAGDDEEEAGEDGAAPSTGDLLGELTDMVLVGADDADSGLPEVHLQFKAEVFGGLHLRLVKRADGLVASFGVHDAAARRAVAGHVDDLIARLRERGFSVVGHSLDILGDAP